MKKRLFTFIWAMFFVLAMSVFATGQSVEAVGKNALRSVTVRIDNKKVAKKISALEIGKSKNLRVSVSPKAVLQERITEKRPPG